MGQPQSSEEGSRQSSRRTEQEESVPYTKYSQSKPSNEKTGPPSTVRGITVVNPKPDPDLQNSKPQELQKLDKIHRFWPILKSTIQNTQPLEKVSDGLEYRDVLLMCTRYQEHLHDTAAIVSIEQRALASRLKDLEMFSAGIAQQMIRRQERMQRALAHLERVQEVCRTLDDIHSSMEQCVPLLQRLNQLLPESDRLEAFQLHPTPQSGEDRRGGGGEGGGGGRGGEGCVAGGRVESEELQRQREEENYSSDVTT